MKLQGLMKVCAAMLFCLGNQQLAAQQLKLGTNPSLVKQSALLELESKKQALLLSRIADTSQIVSPVNGMIIYLESDNTLRIRANNYWTKVIAEGTAIQSINNSFSPTQEIKAVYTPGGAFGFSTTGGIHTLTIPDASPAASGFVNYSFQSFKGLKNFTEGLQAYSLRVTNDVSTPIKILGKDASGDVGTLTIDNNLSVTGGQLGVKNSSSLWNANKIANYDVLFGAAPVNNDVLTFNGTQWIAKAPGGVTSVGLSLPSVFNVTTPSVTSSGTLTATLNTQTPNTFFAGPASGAAAGVPAFRALVAADIPALSGYIQNSTSTQAGSNFNISGNGIIGGTLRVAGSSGTATNILGRDGTGNVSNVAIDATTLKITTGALGAKNTDAIWNAGQLQGKAIAATAPTEGQVLKWNTATAAFVPADDITGGASYGTLPDADIMGAISSDPNYRMKIWKGGGSKVVNGPETGSNGAAAWSVLSFQNSSGTNLYTTQLYFDKNTLALREWGGADPLVGNPSNPWYKVVTTPGNKQFENGGVIYGNMSFDATSEVDQDAANFNWNSSTKRLGLKTGTPNSTLQVAGSVSTNIRTITSSTSFTVADDDYTVIINTPVPALITTTVTITLPNAAAANKGRIYVIKRINAGSRLVVNVTSNSIEAGTSTTLTAGVSYHFQSDGTKWWIIN
ncbi:hypothetical protein [Chitinophaga sp. OAE865]|uniref:hypothetical protein n=1 Tax=Chitinophaga sp. OAE865 TaxID=2817898 RepID=UPI001AE85686